MGSYRDLDVWKRGINLATDLYRITESFPKSELYGLTSQIRRAAVSIPTNVAEGASRRGTAEFAQFVGIARGSHAELETLLTIAKRLGYLNDAARLESELTVIGKQLTLLLRSLSKQNK